MNHEPFVRLRKLLLELQATRKPNPRRRFSDAEVLLVALWAATHHQAIYWATQSRNWPGHLRPRRLPSQSCLSRRLRSFSLLQLLDDLQRVARAQLPSGDVKLIDGRGLEIGNYSKDPDAKRGYAAGRNRVKGYKLHWIVDYSSGAIDGWIVTPMNHPEGQAAQTLIDHLPEGTCYVLGDNAYDHNRLYDLAGERQAQWMAPPRRGCKGLGHQRHSVHRLKVQPFLRSEPGRRAMRHRVRIEQVNGRVGCASVGLSHLPYHARRLHRVTIWVALKILLLTDLQYATLPRNAA